jgi:hypothetical protein
MLFFSREKREKTHKDVGQVEGGVHGAVVDDALDGFSEHLALDLGQALAQLLRGRFRNRFGLRPGANFMITVLGDLPAKNRSCFLKPML